MKVTVQYGKNAYGNDHDNDNFDVILHKCFYGSFTVTFRFARPALGRGANLDNAGMVSNVDLDLSQDHLRKIAAAILWHLESGRPGKPRKLTFKEDKKLKEQRARAILDSFAAGAAPKPNG